VRAGIGSGGIDLGLAIFEPLVEAHRRSVHAESDGAGSGARFVVCLPIAA